MEVSFDSCTHVSGNGYKTGCLEIRLRIVVGREGTKETHKRPKDKRNDSRLLQVLC